MRKNIIEMIRRGLRKPPKVILHRIYYEIQAEKERFIGPRRARYFDKRKLLKATNTSNISELWELLSNRRYPAMTEAYEISEYEKICPHDGQRIITVAGLALEHKVNLLGSGLINLGEKIDWHKDYKSNYTWKLAFKSDIAYGNPDDNSDVKFPWEISRMQWLMPVGQAFLLTQDEKYAVAVKDILEDWINKNPYAYSVNWACTMDVALRVITWTWFFHVFKNCKSWADEAFREKFLCSLFLHGDFIERHLERSDINGNHYTSDAAGLVFTGLFFGQGYASQRWQKLGWTILCEELPRQVFEDGVDFEASVPYHRLVLELFLLPALYREICDMNISESYRERLIAMAHFTAAYSRPDGSVPLWGDADDARVLPFGGQHINDHRYLLGIIGSVWDMNILRKYFSGPRSEIFWLCGPDAAKQLPQTDRPQSLPTSQAFPKGGFYIMCNERDHVFIDCGPVGFGGRGGHGHNDCLSFEAVLDGVHLISDCGAYLYTASYKERNNFRSTAYHNTPRVDGEEINRFVRWDYLWNLHNDAIPEVRQWKTGPEMDILIGSHSGYKRLKQPVTPVRTIILDHLSHSLIIYDDFNGEGEHQIDIPLYLSLGISIAQISPDLITLQAGENYFSLVWNNPLEWNLNVTQGHISTSYGVLKSDVRLVWQRSGHLSKLLICIMSNNKILKNPLSWAFGIIQNIK
jgi:uncharacterized heparinase superfamily protein